MVFRSLCITSYKQDSPEPASGLCDNKSLHILYRNNNVKNYKKFWLLFVLVVAESKDCYCCDYGIGIITDINGWSCNRKGVSEFENDIQLLGSYPDSGNGIRSQFESSKISVLSLVNSDFILVINICQPEVIDNNLP